MPRGAPSSPAPITGALTVLALALDRLIRLWRNRRVEGGRDNPFG